jgi:hypothetical protein
MQETLTEKLDTLKGLFEQIKEGVYSGRPISSRHDRLLAYSEFETRATILKGKYLELSEQETQPLLVQLQDLEVEFRNYGISWAEQNYNQSKALHLERESLELRQAKCKERIPPEVLRGLPHEGWSVGFGGELSETHIKGDGHVNPYERT